MSLTAKASAKRLVVVSGGSRGVGLGTCRQVLSQDPTAHVVVMARRKENAEARVSELGERAHAVQCDVTDDQSVQAAAAAIKDIGGGDLLSLVNNAGFAADLPWFPTPWSASAAAQTLGVNFYGAERLTRALLPALLESADGRVIFVSSGGGRMNLKRMSEERRKRLVDTATLSWRDLDALAAEFTKEYEAAAAAQTEEKTLPHLSDSGLWLQAYGFSKACLGAYCQILSREQTSLLSMTCSPGFVATDMSSTYKGDTVLRSIDEGGEVPAWLATSDRTKEGLTTSFYMPDKAAVPWVAD